MDFPEIINVLQNKCTPGDILNEYISIDNDGKVVVIQCSMTTGHIKKFSLVVRDGEVYAVEKDDG